MTAARNGFGAGVRYATTTITPNSVEARSRKRARRARCAADLDGFRVTLLDTAGLREAEDLIEAEGVRRARAPRTPIRG